MMTYLSLVPRVPVPALLLLALATGCGDSVAGADAGAGGSASGGSGVGGSASGGRAAGGSASGGSGVGGLHTGGTGAGGLPEGGQAGAGGLGGAGDALPVALGAAGDFVILAKTGVATVPISAITGNIGVSPAAATYITGFSLATDAAGVFSSSEQVTGSIYAADYASPSPEQLTQAVSDMGLAFVDAAGRAPDVAELGAGNIGGMTLQPGVYKWGTGLIIPTDLTLAGGAEDVWIFQVAEDLTLSSDAEVLLSGGALPQHVFWQVSGKVELGTTAHCEGVVLSQTSVTLATGASLNGRLLAQSAVNLDGNTVVEP